MLAKRPSISALAAALAVLALSGCGSAHRVGRDGTLRIGLQEYRVVPQKIHATAGVLTLVVHNYGRLTHNLVISYNGQVQVSTKPLAPGQTAVLDAAVIPGTYTISSSILNDQALGLDGTLSVGS